LLAVDEALAYVHAQHFREPGEIGGRESLRLDVDLGGLRRPRGRTLMFQYQA